MPPNPDWRPRVVFDVPEELLSEMSKTFPYGTRNKVLTIACEQILQAVQKHGEVIIYLIMSGKLKLFDGLSEEFPRVYGPNRSI